MANEITVYKGNSKTICVSVPSGYSGYSLNFSVNEKEYGDDSLVFSVTGITITDDTANVTITKEQNNIEERVYFYQVDIIQEPYKHTVVKSTYNVLPSLT